MATKTKAAKVANALLTSIGEQVETLVSPLYDVATTKGKAATNMATWNARVFDVVVWALQEAVAIADVYSVMAQVLTSKVATVGREAKLGAEELIDLRKLCDNTISQLNGPLWTVAKVAEDSLDSVLALATDDGATLTGFFRGTRERVADMMYDSERGSIIVHYKVDDVVRSFTVEQATESREAYDHAMAVAEGIKADESRKWSAVARQFRAEFPCGMLDRRTQADRDKEFASVGEAITAKYSQEEIAKLLS